MNHPLLKLIADLPQAAPDEALSDTLERRVLAAAANRRRLRRLRTAQWLTGGTAVAACAGLVLLMLLPGSGVTWAAVREQMHRAQALTMEARIELVHGERRLLLSRTRSLVDRGIGIRSDVELFGQPMVQVWLPRQGQPLLIDHIHRVVMAVELPPMLDPHDLLRLDPGTLVRQLEAYAGEVERIPASTGEASVGLRFPGPALGLPADARVELWVQPESQLPTRITCRVPLRDDQTLVWTADDFDWNPSLAASQMLPDPPDGYGRFGALVVPPPAEETMLRTLRNYALLSGGAFPTDDMVAWRALTKVLVTALQPDGRWAGLPAPLRTGAAQREALGDAVAGSLYLLQLQDSARQWAYFGDRVRHGDRGVLMRWRLADGAIRVVYGDLQVETLQP